MFHRLAGGAERAGVCEHEVCEGLAAGAGDLTRKGERSLREEGPGSLTLPKVTRVHVDASGVEPGMRVRGSCRRLSQPSGKS